MYSQLVKELIRWEKGLKKNDRGNNQKRPKKDVCHSTRVLEILFFKWFPLEGAEP
jgi:hypothetical protein